MSGPSHNPNLWRQKPSRLPSRYYFPANSFHSHFDIFPWNEWVELSTKQAALKVSPSLVSLISYSGDEPIFWASGFCIESYSTSSTTHFNSYTTSSITHFNNLLTSASLLCLDNNSLPHDFKVEVILPCGNRCPGDVTAFDIHFNVAIIRIQLHALLPSANIKCVDDSIQTQSRPPSNLFKLTPGNPLVALGRFHGTSHALMAAPGKFSIDRCGLDCGELLRLNAKISKCGIGGPVINPSGEVVGISFYACTFVPFLPINVACKWWEDVKSSRLYPKPWLGMQVRHLLSAPANELALILHKFPSISEGIIVEEVAQDSPASLAGIRCNDAIIEFSGENVCSSMELLETAWDKAGESVDLTVLRLSDGARLNISMVVGGLNTEQFNTWPLPSGGGRMFVDRSYL